MNVKVPTVLLIDNYDSFVFNLARYFEELGCRAHVVRNDAVSLTDIDQLQPDVVIMSPGPCTPAETGICLDLVRHLHANWEAGRQHTTRGLLGVCLGHQVIAAALGGKVVRAPEPRHGQATLIHHAGTRLFHQCPSPLQVGRYHSLVADEETLPGQLHVTSRTENGLLMSFEHQHFPIFGVQFHPESILTHGGHQLLENFLQLSGISLPHAVHAPEFSIVEPTEDDFFQRSIDPDSLRPL